MGGEGFPAPGTCALCLPALPPTRLLPHQVGVRHWQDKQYPMLGVAPWLPRPEGEVWAPWIPGSLPCLGLWRNVWVEREGRGFGVWSSLPTPKAPGQGGPAGTHSSLGQFRLASDLPFCWLGKVSQARKNAGSRVGSPATWGTEGACSSAYACPDPKTEHLSLLKSSSRGAQHTYPSPQLWAGCCLSSGPKFPHL